MEKQQPLLLIVEDDVSNIKFLEGLFRKDYRLIPRKNGELAIKYFEKQGFSFSDVKNETDSKAIPAEKKESAQSNLPELILLDIELPGISGLSVCSMLKSNPCLNDIPIIFITGKSNPEDITQGFETGAVDYVAKPFHPGELKARVHTHLQLKSAREDLSSNNRLLREQME